MADDLGADPFASFDVAPPPAPAVAPPAKPDTTEFGPDPFAQFDPENQPVETSAAGAFMHHAEAGLAPSLTGMVGAGMGAQVGAELGAAGGAMIAGPLGAAGGGIVGALGGGIAGFMGGAQAMAGTQEWLLKQLPESWQDLLGQSEKQRAAEEQQQPIASQIGELAPFVVTMRPSIIGPRAPIPAEASTLQRLWASPMTSHVLSAAMQGGTEAVSELASGQKVDPSRIAIATAFGLMFDKPTKLGERLNALGEKPIAMITGRGAAPKPVEVPVTEPERPAPTIAEAADAQVIGPGITEGVFLGSEKQDPALRDAQQTAAQIEADVIGPQPIPNPAQHSRAMEPELFAHYDELLAQRADLAAHPDTAAVQQHLAATDAELRALAPEIAAAHRRAADLVQAETVEPPAPEPVQTTQPAPNGQVPAGAASTLPPPEVLEAQQAAIAQEVTANLIAAGRSPEEAAAGGQLLGHYYRTRAAKFKGALGSPMDLFRSQGPNIRRFGVADAPLMPTAGRPNFVPEKSAPAIPEAAPRAPSVAEPATPKGPARAPAPTSELEAIDPANVAVDAKRFQFKEGGDETGVSERLQGVEKWDPRLAGTALVFRDAEGKNWVADGHQRFGLAKRLMEAGHPPIKVNAFVLEAKAGYTDAQARAIAAVKNIAEGTGSPIDAAKVLREAKESGIDLPPLPPRSALVRDGNALAELSPEAFGAVVNGVVPPNQGALVGRLVRNPVDQVEAVRLLAATKPENATQAEMMIRDMLATGTDQFKQQNLFGEEAFASSIVLERAKVAEEALKQLRRDKSTFRTLVDEAERIEGQGANVLDQSANQSRLTTDEKAADLLTQLAFRAGPVSDELSAVARRFKAKEISAAEAARGFLGAVRSAVESGVDPGAEPRGAEHGAVGERPLDEEGGQTLFQERPDYQGEHHAPDAESGASLSDVTENGIYPKDFYSADGLRYYGTGDEAMDRQAYSIIQSMKGRPNAKVKIYRAVPHEQTVEERIAKIEAEKRHILKTGRIPNDVDFAGKVSTYYDQISTELDTLRAAPPKADAGTIDTINPGDWVSIVRDYAKDHGHGALNGKFKIISKTVPAGQLFTSGDSMLEWGWAPDDAAGKTLYQGRKPEPWREGEMFGGFETERGLEGLPQTLIPGVKPLTDAERMAAAAAKPLKGGEAPPKAGSLFDVEGREDSAAQRELFQPAYHGTPHIFDKFDSSKIGTGEGAQAYGHGLYFASSKDVAQHYRNNLAGRPGLRVDGKEIHEIVGRSGAPVNEAIKKAPAFLETLGELPSVVPKVEQDIEFKNYAKNDTYRALALRDVLNVMDEETRYGRPDTDAVKYWRDKAENAREKADNWSLPPNERPDGYAAQTPEMDRVVAGNWNRQADESTLRAQIAKALVDSGRVKVEKPGRLYHVDVPEPHELMDWDKRLSEQPKSIRDKLADLGEFEPTETGEEIYDYLKQPYIEEGMGDAEAAKNASEDLREAGIPGHQYVGHESGKTNYVIYDDSRVNIRDYEQQKRGAIQFVEGRKPLIKLFKDADASTFLHETGHQWLEDLMRDSVHPQAPDAIKDDAQTVRDWLGLKDIGEQIPTRAHEKFARTFEQYLREGVAPSPGLARIFAQFKTWLTQIYQSIKGLGAPINEDIRSVFDRMLAETPNRTVIAPEALERGPTLHDIHETEAEDASPEQAGPVADRIVAERDDYLARQPAEIRNELETEIARQEAERAAAGGGTEPAGEDGAGGEPSAAVREPGSEPVAEPPSSPGGGQPRPELGGGGEGIPEGVNGPELRSNGPGTAGDARSLPPEPTPVIDRAPKFVDKAGNIRLDNINSTDDIKQVLRDFAEQNNDFIDYRRGVVSKGQILDLAAAIGETDPDFLMRRRIGQSFNAEQIKYAEKLLAQSAQSLAITMKPGAGATPEEVRAYAEARSRHQMIQSHFAGITAEAGRALAALRRTQSFWSPEAAAADKASREATGRTLNQLQQEMALGAELDTPEKVSRFLRDQTKKNAIDGLLEYWISALLSGTKTHVVNDVSNLITAVNHFGPDIAAAALAGRIRKALGREGPRVHASEIAVAAQAAAQKAIPVGVKAMLDAFKAGRGVDLPEQTEAPVLPFVEGAPDLFKGPALDEAATYREVVPEIYGLVKGTIDAAIANGRLLAAGGVAGSPLVSLRDTATGVIPNIAIRGVEIPAGDVIRLPLRSLSAQDSFFRGANYTIEKARTAYRTALEEGLQPNTPEFARRVAQVSENFTPEQMTEAADVAHGLTFMGRRGPFTAALVRLANSRPFNAPLPKFIVPFVSTPLAIIESAVVHRTPLAFLAPEVRADLMGANGNIAQDMAVGRLLMGTLYGVAGAGLASMGLLSGSGPQNSNDAAAWRMAGNQAHSVRIGDMWYAINQLGPIGLWLSMVADGHDVAGAVQQGDWGTVIGGVQQAFSQNIVDMSSLTGVSDLMQAIQDPDRYGNSYVSKFLSSFVPAIVAQVAKSNDPYVRQAQGILESAQVRVPFASQGLPVRRDIYGDPIPQNMPAFGTLYSAKVQTDPLNLAFNEGGYWPGYPKRTIRGVKLTEQQFDEYSMVAGRLLRQNLMPVVNSSQWPTLAPGRKHDILSKAVGMSREAARNYMLGKWPQIAIDAVRQKQAALDGTD